jgi:DNA-binding IclR family transcriptional regulator
MVSGEETPVRSVQRALELLSVIAQGEELSLAKLASATTLAPSTAHRLLNTMVDLGFVRQDDESRRYGPGHRLLGLVGAAEQRLAALRAAALPHMTELASACGETAHLTILDGSQVVFIDQVLGRGTIRVEVKVGSRMDAHVTAAGKALLAWQPEGYLEPLFAAGLKRFTPSTLTDTEEHELGAGCVAAPIMPAAGAPIASLSVSGPTSRLRPEEFAALGQQIRVAADRVADSLAASG